MDTSSSFFKETCKANVCCQSLTYLMTGTKLLFPLQSLHSWPAAILCYQASLAGTLTAFYLVLLCSVDVR